MPDVKYKCTRLTPITFQNEVDVILQSVLLLITYHFLTNQEGGTIMINHFRPHPIGVNKPMLLMQWSNCVSSPTFSQNVSGKNIDFHLMAYKM